MNLLEQFRAAAIHQAMGRKSVSHGWSTRRAVFLSHMHGQLTPQKIINFGDCLSEAFRSVGSGDRSQESLSGGGYVWSALIAWYLNLGYLGTDTVALCGSSFVPDCIKDSVSVNYYSTSVGADLDVVVLAMPGIKNRESKPSLTSCKREIEEFCSHHFNELGLVILQCKTNWNDNAQVPMLWNLLFRQAKRGVIPENGYTFGRNNRNLRNLKHFSYAFATVPTSGGGPSGFHGTKLPVLRVQGMTGGAYWGYPTKSGVCRSIKEFFNHQFSVAGDVMPNVDVVGRCYCEAVDSQSSDYGIGAFGLHGVSEG